MSARSSGRPHQRRVNHITATLKDGDNNPVNLTDVNPTTGVVLRIKSRDGTVARSCAATIVGSAVNGQVSCIPSEADKAVTGGYYAQWWVVFTTGPTTAKFPSDSYHWLEILSPLA
jgi:hypothetical protein